MLCRLIRYTWCCSQGVTSNTWPNLLVSELQVGLTAHICKGHWQVTEPHKLVQDTQFSSSWVCKWAYCYPNSFLHATHHSHIHVWLGNVPPSVIVTSPQVNYEQCYPAYLTASSSLWQFQQWWWWQHMITPKHRHRPLQQAPAMAMLLALVQKLSGEGNI